MTFLFRDLPKSQIAVLFGSLLIVNTLELVGLSLFIPILDFMQNHGPTHGVTRVFEAGLSSLGVNPSLPIFLLLLCVIFVVKTGISLWARLMGVRIASNLQHSLRLRLMSAYTKSGVRFIFAQRQGSLLSVLNEQTVRVSGAFFNLVQVALMSLTALVYGVFVFILSWKLALVAALLGLSIWPVIAKVGRLSYAFGAKNTQALEGAQHYALETLNAKKILNAMGWGHSRSESYYNVSDNVRSSWEGTAFWSNSIGLIVQPFSVIILSVVIVLAVNFGYSTTVLGAFLVASIRLLPAVQSALTYATGFRGNLPSVQRVHEMLVKAESNVEPNGVVEFLSFTSSIRFENVRFQYQAGEPYVLDGVNLELPRGQTVALVGASGSGKTTLVDLILGLYLPSEGRIMLDGLDLNSVELSSFRAKVAYIPQDPILFHDSIKRNLEIGLDGFIDEQKIEQACRQAGAWEFIKEKPDRLDTVIGDRGVQLSGGQRQRLAMARALLRHPQILILDEATSALDHTSETLITGTLASLQQTKEITIIIIAHRYTTIQEADLIYEVKSGQVTSLGVWSEARDYLQKGALDFKLA